MTAGEGGLGSHEADTPDGSEADGKGALTAIGVDCLDTDVSAVASLTLAVFRKGETEVAGTTTRATWNKRSRRRS